MSRTISWTHRARLDVREQFQHIAKENPENARLVKQRIADAVALLGAKPIGRAGRVFGTYEKSVLKTSLIIAYELPDERTLTILRVIHMARDWQAGVGGRD